MKKQFLLIGIGVFLCLGVINQAQAYERIFYDNCESTNYTEHFLEQTHGSSDSGYWTEFRNEITQTTIAHSGMYGLVYDPYQTKNPHSSLGTGSAPYGNLSNINFSTYSNRYWYFRWYTRWGVPNNPKSTGSGNKIFYLGCGGDYFYLAKTYGDDHGFQYVVRDSFGGTILSNGWPDSGKSLYDGSWHKMEVYIDFGSSNAATDGALWVKVDGDNLFSLSNLDFKSLPNPVSCLAWPSNCTHCTGSQEVFLDDMEIFTLENSTDIPPELVFSDTPLSESIDIIDALLTFRNYLGLDMTATTWKTSATGDANCDGVSNSVDVRLLLRDSLDLDMSGTGWCN